MEYSYGLKRDLPSIKQTPAGTVPSAILTPEDYDYVNVNLVRARGDAIPSPLVITLPAKYQNGRLAGIEFVDIAFGIDPTAVTPAWLSTVANDNYAELSIQGCNPTFLGATNALGTAGNMSSVIAFGGPPESGGLYCSTVPFGAYNLLSMWGTVNILGPSTVLKTVQGTLALSLASTNILTGATGVVTSSGAGSLQFVAIRLRLRFLD